jgi:hypothetical protein
MELTCYEHDQGFVLRRFEQGEFDYIDAANEVFEADFFRFIGAMNERLIVFPSAQALGRR